LEADEDSKRRFLKEAKAASALNHPHIVTLYDITSDGHSDVIAMEYVEGDSLRALLSRGSIELRRAMEIVAQIASALAAAHQAGIVHRDIKPENIMVTSANHAKVLDFGLAKLMEPESLSHRKRYRLISR